jgi:hypothetical protein
LFRSFLAAAGLVSVSLFAFSAKLTSSFCLEDFLPLAFSSFGASTTTSVFWLTV